MCTTIQRQWLVLTMLPRAPRRIDTGAIEARLRQRGIEVHRRTIQRDLLDLAEVFPIEADERAKPYGWRWADDAERAGQVPPPRCARTGAVVAVSLRVPKAALGCVLEHLGPRGHRVREDGDALFARVTTTIEDCRSTRRLLLGFADEIEVIAPADLRRELAERARRIVTAHAG